jgi:uncharacterized protein YggL (DUF469 family)
MKKGGRLEEFQASGFQWVLDYSQGSVHKRENNVNWTLVLQLVATSNLKLQ